MTVERCPAGLREDIFNRDGHLCLRCHKFRGGLELHHLINRAGCDKGLRWAPHNLVTLCSKCHQEVTDRREGSEAWTVSKFGDQERSLERWWGAHLVGTFR